MIKLRGADAKLARLRQLRTEAHSAQTNEELRSFLGDKSNLVVAFAAEIVGARVLADLSSDLVMAFQRFMIAPEKLDKGCRALTAIVETLNKIEYGKADVFLRGVVHRQEPIFGTTNDMAGQLRGSSAFGLVRVNYRGAVLVLADLLLDRDIKARTAAVQALGEARMATALPLLRFKTRVGDEDPEVTAECLSAILRIEPIESLPFVAEYLESHDEVIQEGAALALAETRNPAALELLCNFWPRARDRDIRDAVLLSISMLRLPAGMDFVMELLCDQNQAVVFAALNALAIHRHNGALRAQIAAEIAKHKNPALDAKFAQKFDVSDNRVE